MSESNVTPELKGALDDLVAEEARGLGTHPEPGLLSAFRAGELTSEQEEDVRRHLTYCRDCVDSLVLDPDLAPEEERPWVADFETGKAWGEMRSRLRDARTRRQLRLFQLVAAASLVLMVGSFLARAPAPQQTPPPAEPAPIANVDIFDVTRSSQRGPNQPATPITVSPEAQLLTLVFVVGPSDLASHELEIVDAAGRQVWATASIAVRDALVTLSLPSGFLQAGDYVVRIHGQREDSNEVWEFPIRLSYS